MGNSSSTDTLKEARIPNSHQNPSFVDFTPTNSVSDQNPSLVESTPNDVVSDQNPSLVESTTNDVVSDQNPSLVESTTNDVVSDQHKNVPEITELTIENLPEEEQIQQVEGDGEEEEEGECGFCIYMKGGGCKEAFTTWETCIEINKEDTGAKCSEVTRLLMDCMQTHSDYYEPILRAEKEAEAVAVKELEKETQDNLDNDAQNEIASGGHDVNVNV